MRASGVGACAASTIESHGRHRPPNFGMARSTVLTTLKFAVIGLVLLRFRPTNSQQNQAPGDGEAICTEETMIDGTTNPLFDNRPVYSASERPLMDSRDYNRLLQGSDGVYIPWQSVDRDNNNLVQVTTEVRLRSLVAT